MLALRRRRLLFVAPSLLMLALQLGSSPSSAQQYPGDGGGGGGGGYEYYSHEEYADGHRNPDDLYANYAASHANAGRRGGLDVDLVASNRGSAIKLALAFSGGFVGAKVLPQDEAELASEIEIQGGAESALPHGERPVGPRVHSQALASAGERHVFAVLHQIEFG